MAHCATEIATLAAAEAVRDQKLSELCDAETAVLTAEAELTACELEHGP